MHVAPKLLSICIPTFNRDDHLEALFDSIPDKYLDKVEVCVSENPAPDDYTKELVERYCGRFPHFKYEQRDHNYGFDNNLLHVVEMATGKYCWTVGSDDWLAKNALDAVFEILEKEEPSILIVNQITINIDKTWQKKKYWLPPEVESYKFNPQRPEEVKEYFKQARMISAVGAFISSNIFDRELWINTKINREIAVDYTHLNKMAAMIFTHSDQEIKFMYIKENLVYATIDNGAVAAKAWSARHRLFVDLIAVTEIADEYIDDPEIRREYIHILRGEHPFFDLLRTAVIPDCNEDEMRILKRIFPHWQIFICRYLGFRRGSFIHKTLKKLKKMMLT